jgi:nitrogen fixation NifU-like protein
VAGLDTMYQEIILDHVKHPHGRGLREPFGAQVHHVNPTCGDEITLRVTLSGPAGAERVDDVSWHGQGCSISLASASVAHELLAGRPLTDALAVETAFHELVTGRGEIEPDEDVLGDGVAFAGVARYPMRVKCALLPWAAFKDAAARSLAAEPATAAGTSPPTAATTQTPTEGETP